jgi:F-type H+-transporting ATPase subunit a
MDIESEELPNFLTFISKGLKDEQIGELLVDWQDPIFSVFIAGTIAIIFQLGTRNCKLMPKPFQNFLEFIAHGVDSIVKEIVGPEGRKFAPFIGTLFVYIVSMNWAGLVPLLKSPSSNISITVGLAISVFVVVQYLNFKNMGVFGFVYHLAGSPKGLLGWAMVPLMLPVEIIVQLARPLTLSLRLFGNILGEDIFIALATVFGVSLMANYMIPVGLPLQLPFMFLGLFTGFLQALVFTLLTTIYILLSIPDASEEHPH